MVRTSQPEEQEEREAAVAVVGEEVCGGSWSTLPFPGTRSSLALVPLVVSSIMRALGV